jgi:UDP-glucose 4-epimerase
MVTGATGFMGRHLIDKLHESGAEVLAVGRRDRPDLPNDVTYEQVDLATPGAATALVGRAKPDRVYHLASSVDTRRDLELLDDQIQNTQMAAIYIARACLDAKVDRLVHVGTCEEYGDGPAPFEEAQATSPVSPYSAAKAAATAFVQALCTSFGLRAVIVRPFLTYGPGQPPTLLIPALIQSALRGEDFPMTPAEQTREFNYVGDMVEGILRAGEVAGIEGEIFNLGCGEPHRICDVATLVLELMGNPIKVDFGALPYRAGETWEFYCSNQKARERLGWTPGTSLEDGLRKTIHWYQEAAKGNS